ncbi:beta-propeller fold lactonase family protein [Micromonospora zhanjiangensis]
MSTPSPSFLARHPELPVLYAVNELAEGTVSAFTVRPDGGLTAAGTVATGGDSPCHLAVSATGRFLFSANYGSGSVAVHRLDDAGRPGERADLVTHDGHGPVADRQEHAHAHMVSPEPTGDRLLVVDLGADGIYRYDVGPAGRLAQAGPPVRIRPGTGPRHLARHPDGHRFFLAGELDPTVTGYERDADGVLRERARVPASRRSGHVQPSEIAVRPDGRFLYVANRGIGTVTVFALDESAPRQVSEVDTGGDWPRHFALIGDHLYVADERAHRIFVFAVDPESGGLTPAVEPVPVASPTCVLP